MRYWVCIKLHKYIYYYFQIYNFFVVNLGHQQHFVGKYFRSIFIHFNYTGTAVSATLQFTLAAEAKTKCQRPQLCGNTLLKLSHGNDEAVWQTFRGILFLSSVTEH